MYISHSRQLQSILTSDNVKCSPSVVLFVRAFLSLAAVSTSAMNARMASRSMISGACAHQRALLLLFLLWRLCFVALDAAYSSSDYAKFEEIVQMSYLYSRPKVQEWAALRTWQAPDQYSE